MVSDHRQAWPSPPGGPLVDAQLQRVVLMADACDIAAVEPVLELTIGRTSLECSGTLSTRTRRHVLEAAETLLAGSLAVTVDVSDLYVADVDGANTFARLQRMAREAGAELHWVGLESGVLRPTAGPIGRRRRLGPVMGPEPSGA